MNNSKIAIDRVSLSLDNPVDRSKELGEAEARLIRIIEAVSKVISSDEWSTLKNLVFDRRVENLEKQLLTESEKLIINDSELYRLQGRLFEARKYDLHKLNESFRLELVNIRKLTQPTER